MLMNVLFIFTSTLFFIWITREIFTWLALWQQNDYRPDRFFASFRSRKQKSRYFFWVLVTLKWLLFFAYGYIVFNDSFVQDYRYAVFLIFFIQTLIVGKEIYTNSLKKPQLTPRGIVTILLSFFVVLVFFIFPLMENFFC